MYLGICYCSRGWIDINCSRHGPRSNQPQGGTPGPMHFPGASARGCPSIPSLEHIENCVECSKELTLYASPSACAEGAEPCSPEPSAGTFTKDDSTKPRYSLLPWDVLSQVVNAMENGARKYGDENWRQCLEPDRYLDAAQRHLAAELRHRHSVDPDSALMSTAHAVASLLIYMSLMEAQLNPKKGR